MFWSILAALFVFFVVLPVVGSLIYAAFSFVAIISGSNK
jgi:hypothetical protein